MIRNGANFTAKKTSSEIPSATSNGNRKQSRDVGYESDNSQGILVNINSDSGDEELRERVPQISLDKNSIGLNLDHDTKLVSPKVISDR